MAQHVNYYDEGWKLREIECSCGWRGTSAAMSMELFKELIEFSCPTCPAHLLLVSHPTIEQIRAAAAAGNTEAQQHLESLSNAGLRK